MVPGLVKRTVARVGVEDLALFLGGVLVSVGCGIRFGYAIGLIAAGALLVAYGIWLAEGGARWASRPAE